jgi:hypothetical protein
VPNEDLQVRDEYNFHLVFFLIVKVQTETYHALQFKYKKEFSIVLAWQYFKIPVCGNRNTVGV